MGIQGTFRDQLKRKKFNILAKTILSNLGNPMRKGVVGYTDQNIQNDNIQVGHTCRQPASCKLSQIQITNFKKTITSNKSRSVVELGLDGLQHPGRPHVANQLVLLAEDGGLEQVVHLLVARHLHRLILNV